MKKALIIFIVGLICFNNIDVVSAKNPTNKGKFIDTILIFVNDSKEIIKAITQEASVWYEENKEEIKETAKDVYEETKNKVSGVIDKASTWYNENKDDIKEAGKEIYTQDKETFKDLYNKFKKSE